jgi:hypothetical protein
VRRRTGSVRNPDICFESDPARMHYEYARAKRFTGKKILKRNLLAP